MRTPRIRSKAFVAFLAVILILPLTALAQSDASFGVQVERQTADLIDEEGNLVGLIEYWNTRNNFIVRVMAAEPLLIQDVQVYAGLVEPELKKDMLSPSKFPCKHAVDDPRSFSMAMCSLKDDFDHSWGGDQTRILSVHADLVALNEDGTEAFRVDAWGAPEGAVAMGNGFVFETTFFHPRKGHFIDSPVAGLTFETPTNWGVTDSAGGFDYFPGERVDLWVGSVYLGSPFGDLKISPLDIFMADVDIDTEDAVHDARVVNMARLLQSLDADGTPKGGINITPTVTGCLDMAAEELLLLDFDTGETLVDFGDSDLIQALIEETHYQCEGAPDGTVLVEVSAEAAADNLYQGLSASGIFRKNISKEPDFSATKIKLDVMPVYLPGMRSDGTPSTCVLDDPETPDIDETEIGVPYQEWRMPDPDTGESVVCDPRIDGENCVLEMIECREVAKPIVSAYIQKVDIFDENTTTDFYPDRFAHDVFVSISRDDGTTWKRMNVSRMGDLSSFELETGEPFPGTTRAPQVKIVDNKILAVWTSTYCKSGNPRYSITTCDDPDTDIVETPEDGNCQMVCRGDPDQGTEVCEPDYPYDDAYYVEDIWGVGGHQGSVNYDEVDEVETLGIGEIPYSCLWTARGLLVTQADLDEATADLADGVPETSLGSLGLDDPATVDVDEGISLGEIVWFKPERLTSGRRDAYIPVVSGTRGAGFAIAWQEDPEGLRPGKGKGPGQGWSGAISNHKTDIWYSYITLDEFDLVDSNFIPGGPGENAEPNEDAPGVGRPKALAPFSLPVRVSDNDMVNTDTLKIELDADGLPVIDPETGTFIPLDPIDNPPAGEYEGNLGGTKSFAYLARFDPLYEYAWDSLDLCDLSGDNGVMTELPGLNHERWYRFTNTEGSEKTVCVTSDGRLLDGDISASRANIQLQPYKRADGTTSAYVLLAYEESKGMGRSHAEDSGGEQVPKPIKQDYGKNLTYHSFDFTQPDLVSAGHMVNLPATCGGVYENYCTAEQLEQDPDNPTCTCTPDEPIQLFYETVDENGDVVYGDFLQYRTEIARRTRFIAQSMGRMNTGETGTMGVIIYKQGQEGQGRPADVFIRRLVVEDANPGKDGIQVSGNPYAFENFECAVYLDEVNFPEQGYLPGYNNNVWGEPTGDRLCWSGGGVDWVQGDFGVMTMGDRLGTSGSVFGTQGDYSTLSRGHYNLTSSVIDLAVDAGPDDDTPDDPTDDIYGTNKVLLWHQQEENVEDESFESMYSNSRSHRGFIRGDVLVMGFSYSPNWAAARNGRDRYNFYVRRSFDGGVTWTTTPAELGGEGVYVCPEYRTDPESPDPDGSGNLPPVGFDPTCGTYEAPETPPEDWLPPFPAGVAMYPNATELNPDPFETTAGGVTAQYIGPAEFEPARNISMIMNNKETDLDPRIAATPPVPPLDGRDATLPVLRFTEDEYNDNVFFVAWGTGDNLKSTGGQTVTPEAPPLDIYYTRSSNYGDTYWMVPWQVNGENSNFAGEVVWRYDWLAHGDPEQGECQLRATPDGSKMYGIYHEGMYPEEDPDAEITRWYPWEPEESHDNDVWFRRVIFWEDPLFGW